MQTTLLDFRLRRISTVLSVAILTLSLIAAISGVLLSFYYQPTAGGAYNSLKTISETVNNGWLFLKAHSFAGNALIVCGLVQIVVMFLGRQFRKSWLTAWISGIFLVLTAIGLDWTAMILGWTQEGYWRFNIELGTIQAIPFIGNQLRDILTGGNGVSSITVEHLFAIHSYILSVASIVVALVHLGGLLWQERQMSKEMLVSEMSEIAEQGDSSANQMV
ncbi:MAG: cytochrome b N-terminal domain-containing protein [Scytonematopsis contorta HA4267-MV1]|jgi:cytochrome b6|nr:cytochrome b N-terminal domain-containing protein [Scytonematopsis contorta HA4267-MV1]